MRQRITALRVDPAGDAAELCDRCADALSAGFEGIELVVPVVRASDIEDGNSPLAGLLTETSRQDLRVTAVSAAVLVAEIEPSVRHVVRLLELASQLGATCLTLEIPPVTGTGNGACFDRYQDALNFAYQLARRIRFDAEATGVALALEAATGGSLLSPVELREIIDTANSWAVGACVDLTRVARIGSPADWLQTLGHRVHAVRLGEAVPDDTSALSAPVAAVDVPAVATALDRIAYQRPIIVDGNSSACELRSSLARLE